MTMNLNISDKIPNDISKILCPVAELINDLGLPYFVLGATARDLILCYVHSIPESQATRDIDLGVCVSNWEDYKKLKTALTDSKMFSETGSEHRLKHYSNIPLDLIPFGGIANDNEIVWPPKYEARMNILGYEEALHSALEITISENPPHVIKVASPVGLSILKIISWNDDPERRRKDAQDLYYVIDHYIDLGNRIRLSEGDSDILSEQDLPETIVLGARMLGRDMNKILKTRTKEYIIEILISDNKLNQHMLPRRNTDIARIDLILKTIVRGIKD